MTIMIMRMIPIIRKSIGLFHTCICSYKLRNSWYSLNKIYSVFKYRRFLWQGMGLGFWELQIYTFSENHACLETMSAPSLMNISGVTGNIHVMFILFAPLPKFRLLTTSSSYSNFTPSIEILINCSSSL